MDALTPGNPQDDALLVLLTHTAISDGSVDDSELAFLADVLPNRDPEALRAWAVEVGSRPLDLQLLRRALPDVEARWRGVRYVARMAWKDNLLEDGEKEFLERLVSTFELPEGAMERVVEELAGRGIGSVDEARLKEALSTLSWDTAEFTPGPVRGPLARVVPAAARPISTIRIDDVEMIGLLQEGIAGLFREGAAFIRWPHLVTYTREPTLGAALKLHTESGRTWTLVDARLSGLSGLLDRLTGRVEARPPRSEPPVVEVLRGE